MDIFKRRVYVLELRVGEKGKNCVLVFNDILFRSKNVLIFMIIDFFYRERFF